MLLVVLAPVLMVVDESPWLTVLFIETALLVFVVVVLGLLTVVEDVPELLPDVAPMFWVLA